MATTDKKPDQVIRVQKSKVKTEAPQNSSAADSLVQKMDQLISLQQEQIALLKLLSNDRCTCKKHKAEKVKKEKKEKKEKREKH